MATIVLVRHGETAWNRDRRVQGWAAVPLNDRGREQAVSLATAIESRYDVDRLIASDLRRTLETARPIARKTGVAVEPSTGWRERDFGAFQGLSYRELFSGYPEFAIGTSGYPAALARPESGESFIHHRERVLAAFDRLVDSLDSAETAVVVTHGGSLYQVLGRQKGLDIVETVMDQSQGNGAINELAVDTTNGNVSIVSENDTAYRDADR